MPERICNQIFRFLFILIQLVLRQKINFTYRQIGISTLISLHKFMLYLNGIYQFIIPRRLMLIPWIAKRMGAKKLVAWPTRLNLLYNLYAKELSSIFKNIFSKNSISHPTQFAKFICLRINAIPELREIFAGSS